jgi:hypothetical protein
MKNILIGKINLELKIIYQIQIFQLAKGKA